MIAILEGLFKNPYQDLQPICQIMFALEQLFVHDKFVDGQTSKDAAINALISELQTKLSTYVAPPSA